ncbi:hypothetical protein AAVH_01148 [Aphelenchoides avenae]|nr:hypothetical protein AAVH_01148 [Aphelenchus avenae]
MADDGNCTTHGNLDGQAMPDAMRNHETGPSVADLADDELTGIAAIRDPNVHEEPATVDRRPKPRQPPRSQPKPTQVRPQQHAPAIPQTEENAVLYDATMIEHPTTSTMTAVAPRRLVAKPSRMKTAFNGALQLPQYGPTVKEHLQQQQLAQRQHEHQQLMQHLKDEDDMKKRRANANVSQQAASTGAPGQPAHHYIITEHVTPSMADGGGDMHYDHYGDNMTSVNYLTYPSGVGDRQNLMPANNAYGPVDGSSLPHATSQPGMTMVSRPENNRGPTVGPTTHRYIVTSSSHPQQFAGHAPVHVHADAAPPPRQMVAPPILRQPKATGIKAKTTKMKIEKDPLLSTIDRVASGDVPLSASMSKRIMNDNHDLFSDLEPAEFDAPVPAKPPLKRGNNCKGCKECRC